MHLICYCKGKDGTIIDYGNKVNGFVMKLEMWSGKIAKRKFNMFETLQNELHVTSQSDEVVTDDKLKLVVQEHLSALHQEMSVYFNDVISTDLKMIEKPILCI